MQESMKVQLVNPIHEDQDPEYLYFTMEDNARFKYKEDISRGLATDKYLDITKEYVSIPINNDFNSMDVHKVLSHEDMYLVVTYSRLGTYPLARMYSKEKVIELLKNSISNDELLEEHIAYINEFE